MATPIICSFLYPHLSSNYHHVINDGYLVASPKDLPIPAHIHEIFIPTDGSPESHKKNVEDILYALEADTFWCLTLFLERIQDNYTPIQPGIQ